MSNLSDLISKLSKASAESVHTLSDDKTSLFKYLHVETLVEKEYIKLLESQINTKSIIFLCGSSGDGKSAIISNNKTKFESNYDFHIDATHSFKPTQTAIEALDESFSSFDNNDKSLVVGINIGILMNYIKEGNPLNIKIKESIENFLLDKNNKNNIYFINFENYSKFEFNDSKISSPFIEAILNKITLESNSNPFYDAFNLDIESEEITILHQNFKLLSTKAIKSSIVELLITVNLKYDQFITTRSLLDFIYTILNGSKLLINQLFEDDSNSIIQNIRKEDPVLIRTFQLDEFILERSSNKEDKKLFEFIDTFNNICHKNILDKSEPFELIRTFYLFRHNDISTNYHKNFLNNVDNSSIYDFINLVSIHKEYKEGNKKTIRLFYKDIEKAILFYVNKKIPTLTQKSLFTLSSINKVTTVVPIEIKADVSQIKEYTSQIFSHFPLYLKVNSSQIASINITLNMFLMIHQINDGYR
ncbi:MAG: DNA phosphorothioation-dependent restriction protein DptF, partial [Arcobacteraceae bacterium]|nr:DNA phosphorothioation-dependent restriction protein DptF [Arcobacteraceae bacterium]